MQRNVSRRRGRARVGQRACAAAARPWVSRTSAISAPRATRRAGGDESRSERERAARAKCTAHARPGRRQGGGGYDARCAEMRAGACARRTTSVRSPTAEGTTTEEPDGQATRQQEPTHPPNGANEDHPSRAQQTRRGSRASFPGVKDEERQGRQDHGRPIEDGGEAGVGGREAFFGDRASEARARSGTRATKSEDATAFEDPATERRRGGRRSCAGPGGRAHGRAAWAASCSAAPGRLCRQASSSADFNTTSLEVHC